MTLSAKEIKYDIEAGNMLIKRVDALADAVQVTLGPRGGATLRWTEI